MFIILGHTPKGETFVIGHTGSRRKVDRFQADFILGRTKYTEEYDWTEVQHSAAIA